MIERPSAAASAARGEACDASADGFVCFPAPNDTELCGTCSNANGPFCLAGSTCLEDKCAHYCCDDGDCGTGTCDKALLGDPNVGVCVDDMGAAACDAPVMSPSGGTCFMP